jgi:nitrogen-specific signal transduction histidine kinase
MIIAAKSKGKVELELVIDNLPNAIIVLDRDRRILLANKRAEMIAKKSRTDFYGLYGGEALGCVNSQVDPKGCGFAPICEFCEVKNAVLDTFRTGVSKSLVEAEMTFIDLGKRYLRISTTLLSIQAQKVVILALEDITKAKTQEKLKLENEKLTAAIETGGAVCHEMNQPLMAVMGYLDLITFDMEETDKNYNLFMDMKGQLLRLGEITEKLMHLHSYKTKKYLGKSRILDLNESSKLRIHKQAS